MALASACGFRYRGVMVPYRKFIGGRQQSHRFADSRQCLADDHDEEDTLMGRLDGKVALVTGGGGGLGTAISVLFASEGAKVVVQDLNEAAAAATADQVIANGGEAMSAACDVSDSKAIEAMFADIDDRFGPVTVLVNNAGVDSTPGDGSGEGNTGGDRQIVDMSDDGWQRMLDI
ncbi:MAG: SDR family oxidoreductase, partial [Acidimicrobiia bacterium]|nr:SDR family oxidoreductase [Acidimicrobiia bacterium]